jgi:hypothetical protein
MSSQPLDVQQLVANMMGSEPSTEAAVIVAAAAAAAPPAASSSSAHSADATKLQDLRKSVPWTKDPKFFKKVAVSPSAIMKIMVCLYSPSLTKELLQLLEAGGFYRGPATSNNTRLTSDIFLIF